VATGRGDREGGEVGVATGRYLMEVWLQGGVTEREER
jgi:hypothetical protein